MTFTTHTTTMSCLFNPAVSAAIAMNSPFFAGHTDPDLQGETSGGNTARSIADRFVFAEGTSHAVPAGRPTIRLDTLHARLIGENRYTKEMSLPEVSKKVLSKSHKDGLPQILGKRSQ